MLLMVEDGIWLTLGGIPSWPTVLLQAGSTLVVANADGKTHSSVRIELVLHKPRYLFYTPLSEPYGACRCLKQ